MKRILQAFSHLVVAITLNLPLNAIANSLLAEQWELSRSGDALRKIPVINRVINQWLLKPDQRIELHYPGGEEGELWVGELRDWLVSLGVPSKSISVIPGSGAEDVIKLHVVRIGESYK
jgi:hypothetical protein